MGLFDFIKDIGYGKKDDKDVNLEQTLRESVQKAQLDIRNFTLKLDKGTATLSGTAGSLKDAEIARLIVGNHKGVEKVNDDALNVVPRTPTPLINPQGTMPVGPATAAATSTTTASSSPSASSSPTSNLQAAKMVQVKSGDTLSKIAKEYLGSANRYPEIFEANKPMLKDPDEIFPGQILRIPAELSVASAAH